MWRKRLCKDQREAEEALEEVKFAWPRGALKRKPTCKTSVFEWVNSE